MSKPFTVTTENDLIMVRIKPGFYNKRVDTQSGLAFMEECMVGLRRELSQAVLDVQDYVTKDKPKPTHMELFI